MAISQAHHPGDDPLALPLSAFRRIGPALAEELAGHGLATGRDLLLHRPSRYEDRRGVRGVGELVIGDRATVLAAVRRPRPGRLRRGGATLTCQLVDPSGQLTAVWFNARPWQLRDLSDGRHFFFTGTVKLAKAGGRVVFNPEYEAVEDGDQAALHFGRVVPLYTGSGHPRALRSLVGAVLDQLLPGLDDPLPESVRAENGLVELQRALRELHFPAEGATADELERGDTEARRRLAFDEFLWISLDLARRRHGMRSVAGYALRAGEAELARAMRELPFEPTGAQRRVLGEIACDLCEPHPMQRLLEGDVGSGKTAVAAVALRLAVESGKQGALMAPTELLAEQHHQTLRQILEPAGVKIHLVTASTGGAKGAARALAEGEPCVAVGTHALIQGELDFGSLALAVVDEQHRFGVQDRLKLQAKGRAPHVLLMSATPIPRTLALAVHGDLDVSVLDELPPGRRPVQTKLYSGKARAKGMDALHATIAAGQQAYVVYPLVSESEKLDLANATDGAAKLRAALPGARVGLVHGQLPTAERESTMKAFREGRLDVLVATTVIEVGVDVPNATLAIVSQAERFGLSQLHQLRGRVGRGGQASQCLLLAHGPLSRAARQRLKALVDSHDGFHIAEVDLRMRGPGELLGTRQSGLPELSFADPIRQAQLLERARQIAFDLVERDPELASPEAQRLARGLERLFGHRQSLGRVG